MPEDHQTRQLAVGFLLPFFPPCRQIRVLPPARGWLRAVDRAREELRKNPVAHVALVIDFDHDQGRSSYIRSQMKPEEGDRLMILGSWEEAGDLKGSGLGSLESVGARLAEACQLGEEGPWVHPLLAHNQSELEGRTAPFREILGLN